ncbi:hypothetical protein L1049_026322 [Liquidambar formosana]|uniref:ZF-HD dimerization-type domain-containing protein n=1 Tax=Liquidambar formosana TaxID=63359 RepID=A0AAP0NGR8_LIQFO
MKGMDLSVVPYAHITKTEADSADGDTDETKPVDKNLRSSIESPIDPVVMNPKTGKLVKYRECMKNHAASIGGHANDGCGEFMPSGESLICAACGCHRNFHRREVPGGEHHYLHLMHSPPLPPPPLPPPPMLLYNGGPTTPRWDKKKMRVFTASVHAPHPHHQLHGGMVIGDVNSNEIFHHDDDDEEEREYDRRSGTPERGDVQVGIGAGSATATTTTSFRNKRFRTKFTQEQKEKMLEFAERLGWRIQKHDDVALTEFCSELGIKRNVLKVWMHNNKNAHRRKETAPQSPAVRQPPPPPPPPQPQLVGV